MQKTAFCSQLSPIASIPWWVGVGTQVEHVNSSHLSQFDGMDQHEKSGGMLKSHHIMGQAPEKEKDSVIHLDFSAGNFLNFVSTELYGVRQCYLMYKPSAFVVYTFRTNA